MSMYLLALHLAALRGTLEPGERGALLAEMKNLAAKAQRVLDNSAVIRSLPGKSPPAEASSTWAGDWITPWPWRAPSN